MSFSNLFFKIAIGAVAGFMLSASVANATIWDVVGVSSGTSGGFGFSGFHDGRPPVMSGSDLGAITNGPGVVFGSFDDVNGQFNASLTTNGNVFTLTSTGTNFNFGASGGFLTNVATLDLNFGSNPITLGDGSSTLTTTTLGFLAGDICCSAGPSDPNSFNIAMDGLTAIMTLWGANGFDGVDYTASPTLGMDLRLSFNINPNQSIPAVPLPAALPLYGTGLAIMGFVAWRRKRKAAG